MRSRWQGKSYSYDLKADRLDRMVKIVTRPLSISEEQLLFAQEHSAAITQFVNLEQILGDLVAAGIDKTSSRAVRTAFFGIESFRAKLEFTDRYIQLRVSDSPELLALWANVLRACNTANTGRNQVVHYSKITYVQGEPGRRIVLVPPPANPSRRKEPLDAPREGEAPQNGIGVRRLVEIRYTIFAAFMRVSSYRDVASDMKDSLAGVPEPKAPTLKEMTANFRHTLAVAAAQAGMI